MIKTSSGTEVHLKDPYSCPIEVKGLTDKGQFQYLAGLNGPQKEITCTYNTTSFTTKININILSEST